MKSKKGIKNKFSILVEGDYALFTKPELKSERYSYPFPTESALDGMLKNVFWRNGTSYSIDEIIVVNPIKYESIKMIEQINKIAPVNVRLEIKNVPNGEDRLFNSMREKTLRNSVVLRDVKYVIKFHIAFDDGFSTEKKNECCAILLRRLKKGARFRPTYLGISDYPANIELLNGRKFEPHESFKGINEEYVILSAMNYKEDKETLSVDPEFKIVDFNEGVIRTSKKEELEC